MLPWSKCSKQTAFTKKTTGRTEPRSTEKCLKQIRRQCPSCSPSFKLKTPSQCFTRLAISVNCDHNWFTNSYGPPNRRTSINDDTFATTGNIASRAPDSSTIKSSAKRYSRSRTTRGPRRMCFFRRSSSLSLRVFPVSFKIQNSPARSLQSQSLVTSKVFHPLIVSQDLMTAMRPYRDIFSTNPTKEMARFASCIGSPSDEELTHFVRPHTFFFLNVRIDRTPRRE